jgi:CHAT domain-containing protein
MSLSLNADLVILSACDTAIGQVQGEEGMGNLVRAFLLSGAKAVVANLWSATDVYRLNLMQRFYVHIAGGQTKTPRSGRPKCT